MPNAKRDLPVSLSPRLGEPPEHISEDAKREFRTLRDSYVWLTEEDRPLVLAYAKDAALSNKAEKLLNEEIDKDDPNRMLIHTYRVWLDQSRKGAFRCMKELGASPLVRRRVQKETGVVDKNTPQDEF